MTHDKPQMPDQERIVYLQDALREIAMAVALGRTKIMAIRAWRAATGVSLKDAKDYIDSIWKEISPPLVEPPPVEHTYHDRLNELEMRVSRLEEPIVWSLDNETSRP